MHIWHKDLNYKEVDFNKVCEIIKKAGLTTFSVELTQKAFENSYVCVFIYFEDELIGAGTAISDGAYQAAIYDIVVLPEYQGKGFGRVIVTEILKRLKNLNIILYARPGVENFYRKFGFSKMLTGMVKFTNADVMKSRGFTDTIRILFR